MREKLKIDTRLSKAVLSDLRKVIGFPLKSFFIEKPQVTLPPAFSLENYGRLIFEIGTGHYTSTFFIANSIFQESSPYGDTGGINIDCHEVTLLPLQERMKEAEYIDPRSALLVNVVSCQYPERSPVKSFEFYGDHERRDLKEIDVSYDLEEIKRRGFNDWPSVEVDTVEFFVITHENGIKSIISTMEGGFYYDFVLEESSFNPLLKSYCTRDGRNIVLQHEVR